MHQPNNDEKRAEVLRWLLHAGLDALKERLARRVEQWMQHAPIRRDAKKPETVTLDTDDYKEIP